MLNSGSGQFNHSGCSTCVKGDELPLETRQHVCSIEGDPTNHGSRPKVSRPYSWPNATGPMSEPRLFVGCMTLNQASTAAKEPGRPAD